MPCKCHAEPLATTANIQDWLFPIRGIYSDAKLRVVLGAPPHLTMLKSRMCLITVYHEELNTQAMDRHAGVVNTHVQHYQCT